MKTLYIFLTHKGNINNCYDRIKNMMVSDFIVVVGGYIKDSYDTSTNILKLNCNDTYGGLPEKVMKTFNFIISEDIFNNYDYFCKLDDDMFVLKRFENIHSDYFGYVFTKPNPNTHHVGRCKNFLDRILYMGDWVPYCSGGMGYVISRNALEKIIPNHDYIEHLYEDLYVGMTLSKVGIYPQRLITLTEYIKSPEHG